MTLFECCIILLADRKLKLTVLALVFDNEPLNWLLLLKLFMLNVVVHLFSSNIGYDHYDYFSSIF